MSKNNFKDGKAVLLTCLIAALLIFSSILVEFNWLDLFYLLFIVGSFIKYLIICKKS